MFNPLFKLSDSHLPAPVILFATFGGLRGAVSLILAQMLVSEQDQQQKSRDMLQTAQVSAIAPFCSCSQKAKQNETNRTEQRCEKQVFQSHP